MKTFYRFGMLAAMVAVLANSLAAQTPDPLRVETYILENGLTVILNEDHSKPEIFGAVAVKAGSKNDPADATGIAHYFEHIMFKGTDKIGTLDYPAEKVYLDSITMMYDSLAKTTAEEQRQAIQMKINRLSLKAADYAIPNEVDVILRDIGSSGLNAYTSYDETVYHNSFPSNQIEKWMDIYAERFRNPVFRLFQSELETVYEEKNMYADSPFSTMFETLMKTFYKNHPYGIPILGTKEHLKNPRLSKMMDFFKTYYVANNMALILCGDFNMETVKPMIAEKFGNWPGGEIPKSPEYSEPPFKGREFTKVKMTPVRVGVFGFRGVPNNHPDEIPLEICNQLLSNEATTGLFDKLVMDNQLLIANAFSSPGNDMGGLFIMFAPKIIGQSFESADALILAQLDSLRKGRFSDELLEAVKLSFRKDHLQMLETTEDRAYLLIDAFVTGSTWEDVLEEVRKADKVSREDIMRVAGQYYGPDYLAYWSKMGFPKKDKISKPAWDPVLPKNTEARSGFAKRLDERPETHMEPRFLSFDEDLQIEAIKDGYMLYATDNPYNNVFSLTVSYMTGKLNNPKLEQAVGFMDLIGTEDKSYDQFRAALQALGASCYFEVYDNYVNLHIDGFDENIIPTLQLVNELLTRPKSDEKQLDKFIQQAKANFKMMKEDPMTLGNALYNYALYRGNSPYLRQLSLDEIKELKGSELISLFAEARKTQADFYYSGTLPATEVKQVILENITLEENPVPGKYVELQPEPLQENTVYVNEFKKAIQNNIYFFAQGQKLDERDKAVTAGFNEYFGTGMSSLVFQEIREFRSLSYAAYAYFRTPYYKANPGSITGYLGTQADKTLEGVQTMYDLFTAMPQKPERTEGIRKALLQSIFTEQPGFREIPGRVARWKNMGYDSDPREYWYSVYKQMNFDDIHAFYKIQLMGKPLVITISGNIKAVKSEELNKFGRIIEVKQKEIIKE